MNPMTWFQLIFSKSSKQDWLLNFSQPWDIMLYLVRGEFEKKSGSIKNCGRWSDILDGCFQALHFWPVGWVYYKKCYQLEFYCY